MSKDIKQFLEEELKKEEIATMKEVAEDKELEGLVAPEEMTQALFAKIDAYEKDLAKEDSRLTAEEKELIQLGKVYRRRKKYTKYWVLAAALILALAIGTTSIGGPKKVIRTIVESIKGKGTEIETVTDDGSITKTAAAEDEAYRQVKEKWEADPVQLVHLPECVRFGNFHIDDSMNMIQLNYYKEGAVKIMYQILPRYATSSFITGMEEKVLDEYKDQVKGVAVTYKGYQVEDGTERWVASFTDEKVQYFLWVYDSNEEEITKIVENLNFL